MGWTSPREPLSPLDPPTYTQDRVGQSSIVCLWQSCPYLCSPRYTGRAEINIQRLSTRTWSTLGPVDTMGRNKKTSILSTSSAVPDEDIDMDDCPDSPLSLDPDLSFTTPDGLEAHITVGATVELNDGSFMRVRRIDQSKTRHVETFSGELFRRVSELPGLLLAVYGQNELVFNSRSEPRQRIERGKLAPRGQ